MGNVLTKKRSKKSCCRWMFVGSEKEMYCDTNTKTKTKAKGKTKTTFVGSEKEMYYQRRSSYCSVSFPDNR